MSITTCRPTLASLGLPEEQKRPLTWNILVFTNVWKYWNIKILRWLNIVSGWEMDQICCVPIWKPNLLPISEPSQGRGLFLWLFGELSDQDGWIGQILFIQYGIKRLQSRAGNNICYRKLFWLTITFVQVDPSQQQKFPEEMSLSLLLFAHPLTLIYLGFPVSSILLSFVMTESGRWFSNHIHIVFSYITSSESWWRQRCSGDCGQ